MKNVTPTQVLNGKMRPKQIAQFVGCREVKAHRDTASVTKLDVAPVQTMVEFEISGPIEMQALRAYITGAAPNACRDHRQQPLSPVAS